MRAFSCECGQILFFENSVCVTCGRAVGYEPVSQSMRTCDPAQGFARCANGVKHGVCNWLVPHDPSVGAADLLCTSCVLTRIIPDVGDPEKVRLWGTVEAAKRRLLVTLWALGIDLPTKSQDELNGIAFEIVSSHADPTVMMGHGDGVITIHLEEADDVRRMENRQRFREASRTMLGHFRHESGHYIWDRWQKGLPEDHPHRLAFRERFGDERHDYGDALRRHYAVGAPADWRERFISEYATCHPWEDWAESWNYYLHMIEGLETLKTIGFHPAKAALQLKPFAIEVARLPAVLGGSRRRDAAFLKSLNQWAAASTALNMVAKSVGEPPLSPFVLSIPVVGKLRLIHWLIHESGVFSSTAAKSGIARFFAVR
ncbi:MAG: putative zinc-binding metallopeptidase [Prosthecobacter sp.]